MAQVYVMFCSITHQSAVPHPSIVQCFGFFKKGEELYPMMEYVEPQQGQFHGKVQ